MQIRIFVIGPVFWPGKEMGSSGRCFPLSTSGPRPNSKYSRSEQIPAMVEEIVSTLGTGVYLDGGPGSSSVYVSMLCRIFANPRGDR